MPQAIGSAQVDLSQLVNQLLQSTPSAGSTSTNASDSGVDAPPSPSKADTSRGTLLDVRG